MSLGLENLFGLSGRVALVTGSSRGIGASIAKGLASAGAEGFVHGQTLDATRTTCEAIAQADGVAHAIGGNLAEKGQGRNLVETVEQRSGQLDILVINASAQVNASLADLTDEALELQLAVNLRATIELLQASLPPMAKRGWGRVVSIGSINQDDPKGVVTAYAATKAAQHNLIRSQAREYASHNVLLNTLSPGLIDTDRNAARKNGDPDGWVAYTKQINWMGRAGEADEMVGAAVFLASPAASFITGQSITLSGGS
ncbi:SDR family NAD(P)-dependent oxidoreductase [uncultured Nitratireductor sp.]|uniref:SDR family NAD(P)-dependent oxidoreductase n=1 Tax=uncultured Nitratireductor sp. TaxID=520953 RepID=UPI0025FB0C91|nr:SDR family NAD(P)-dependent oxidoreductase [uncultured Nitratireductor sp.]